MTQIAIDTELSAINSILGSIGQAPAAALNANNPEHAFVQNLLREANIDVQNEGWHFNIEYHKPAELQSNGHIYIKNDVLRYDISDGQSLRTQDVVRRADSTLGGDYVAKLYNLVDHTYVFSGEILVDITSLIQFTDLPPVFQRYVTSRAASRAAAQLVSNPELVQLLQTQEALTRASVMEYETQQGDHSYMGWGHNTSYSSYQPYKALRR